MRVLKAGGRAVIFTPNRGYPFETHGIYWGGKYRFGNKLFVNYLPRRWRNRLGPARALLQPRGHSGAALRAWARVVERTVIFGAYDNLISRFGFLGRLLRALLQSLERTPLRVLGLSHFWGSRESLRQKARFA